MSDGSPVDPGVASPQPAETAGEMLRRVREAAGLSIDAVSQQLKLHPRQVKALEDGEYELLPGRTFVRGFLRNYARLLQLDPDVVLAGLPDSAAAPALERPALAPSPRPMGEIRFDAPRPSFLRWAIPVVLVAVIAIAALYEFTRGGASLRTSEPAAVAPAAAPTAPSASAPATEPGTTPLPNPLANADTGTAPVPTPAAPPAGAPTAGAAGAPVAPPASAPLSTVVPAAQPGEATLVVVFRDRSWVDIRDATGKPLLRMTGTAGTTQSVSGTPPYDIVVGYVPNVQLTFRGAPVDLSQHNVGNVARFRLP